MRRSGSGGAGPQRVPAGVAGARHPLQPSPQRAPCGALDRLTQQVGGEELPPGCVPVSSTRFQTGKFRR